MLNAVSLPQDSHAGHDAGKPLPAADAVRTKAHDDASGKHAQMMEKKMEMVQVMMEGLIEASQTKR